MDHNPWKVNKPQLVFNFKSPVYAGPGNSHTRQYIFKPDNRCPYLHPGPGNDIRWGCFSANFWFWCKAGRTDKEALATARRVALRYMAPSIRDNVESIELQEAQS